MPSTVDSARLWRVLVVEDEALIAEEIQDRLVRMGCQVAGVTDTGARAIALAEETLPELVLMDIRLKGPVDGIQAAQEIFRRFDIPVVFLTAHSDKDTFQRTQTEGTFGYLLKPFHARDLSVAMAMAVSRFRMNQRVRESEHIHATVVNSIADAALVTDTEGRIHSMNTAAAALTGWDVDEAVGRNIEQVLVMAGDPDNLRNPALRALQSNSLVQLTASTVLFNREGRPVPVEGNAAPMVDSTGKLNGAIVVLRDITERRLAEERLRQSNSNLEASQRIAGVGSWEVNVEIPGRLEDAPRRWSDECFRVFGYKPGETEPSRSGFLSRIHPEDRAPVWEAFCQAVETGSVYETEHRVVLRDGQERILHERAEPVRDPATGKVMRYIGTAQDVTSQRQAEKDLRESERRLRAVVEGMPVLLLAFDRDRPAAWNLECERVTGYRAEEIVGNSRAAELFYPDAAYRAQVMETFKRAGGDSRGQQWTLSCKDGTRKTIEWSSISDRVPIPGWSRWIVGVDVTERLSLEEDLRQAQKMQALGQLAGGVAHDFNNLLMVINGFSNMLVKDLAGQPAFQQKADHIRTAGNSAAVITDQLLAFSQKRVVQPELVDLNRIVHDSRAILRQVVGQGIALDLDLAPGLHPVLATDTTIQQVLVNLTANARDAMAAGGRLAIRTANASPQQTGGTPCVRLTVQDSGHGIPPALIKKIFEPFFTTKEAGKGTGLGLATVYGIVKQRGGWVDVESQPGHGATFHIYLPAAQQPAPERVSVERTNPKLRPMTILLAEDEAAVRDLCAGVLESYGSTVLRARDGVEALEIARQYSGRIDLLVSDIAMPALTGPQLFEQLKLDGWDLPALFISGYPNEELPLGSRVELLAKPFLASQLLEAIDRTLNARPGESPSAPGSRP